MFLKYKEFKNAVIKANLLKEEDFYSNRSNAIFTRDYHFNIILNGTIPENLVEKYIDLNYCKTILFKCCLCKRLDIIKFLIENNQQKIYKEINYKKIAFELSCFKGFTKIGKYLYEVFDIKNEKINIIKIFNKVCENNELSTAKWLKKTFNINVANCYDLFYKICTEKFNVRIAKWLYELGKIDLIKNDDIFEFFIENKIHPDCYNKHFFVMNWLVKQNNNYILKRHNGFSFNGYYYIIFNSSVIIDNFVKNNKLFHLIKLLQLKII